MTNRHIFNMCEVYVLCFRVYSNWFDRSLSATTSLQHTDRWARVEELHARLSKLSDSSAKELNPGGEGGTFAFYNSGRFPSRHRLYTVRVHPWYGCRESLGKGPIPPEFVEVRGWDPVEVEDGKAIDYPDVFRSMGSEV